MRWFRVFFFIVAVLWTGFFTAFNGTAAEDFRQPAVSGSFYPDDSAALSKMVRKMISDARDQEIDGRILGLVAPHAGYVYSGEIAAAAYKQVEGKAFDIVVIIAPSHRDSFFGATIYPGKGYATPLGKLSIAGELSTQLAQSCDAVRFSKQGHRQEHAVEVQLPFVQTVFSEPPEIIPLVIGRNDLNTCKTIAEHLAAGLRHKRALIVASTDLYHGYSYAECKQTDKLTLNAMLALQPDALYQGFASQAHQACGGPGVVIMEMVAKALGATEAVLLDRTNSNDVMAHRSGYVVGYAAIAVYGHSASSSNGKIEYPRLGIEEQRYLLKTARQAIERYFTESKVVCSEPVSDILKQKRGVFVTINKNGRLRGCIGAHRAFEPVYKLVADRAVAAAFDDPRFPPLKKDELDDIVINVSVYTTNVYEIDSIEEFEMGKHGIIMIKDGRGATFLPKVPIKAGWKSKAEEMQHLCYKAGLNLNAWKKGARFYVYETQVFGEDGIK